MSRLRRPRLRMGVIFLLLLSLILVPTVAQAENSTPDTAQALDVTNNSVSDMLVGSTGGAYKYYRVTYQGGSAPVLFSLTYQPAYGGGNQAFGFNLYGPSSLSFAGQVTGSSGSSATAQYTLVNSAGMDVLIQVYNYTAGGPVSYTLTVSGLSGGSAATVVSQTNTTPSQASTVTTINASLGGTITGNPAGTYQYFNLHYPGGNTPLAITMNASPGYTGSGQAYGFNVYRTIPNGSTQRVGQSSVTAQDSNGETLSLTLSAPAASDYQLQVFNYWPGVAVSYGIQVTGLAGPATAASDNLDAGHAIVLNSARPGATQTLAGSSSGAFNYYLVNYPGSQSVLSIAVTFTAMSGASPNAVGFKIYNGSTLEATVNPLDDGSGVYSSVWTFQDPNPATFGIQIFNYQPGVTVSYTIYQVGSQ